MTRQHHISFFSTFNAFVWLQHELNENTDSNTTVVLPPRFDTSIQTQLRSDSDASVGENDVASARLYQRTNHHGNMDNKYNDDSQSYETTWGKFRSSYFGDTISTTTTLRSSTLTPPGK